MTDSIIVAAVGFLVGLIAIISPILKLNGSVVRLTTCIENLEKLVESRTKELSDRITRHGEEIDDLRAESVDHEARIKHLEKA